MCDHCGCRSFPPIAELTADHELILGLAWSLAESDRIGAGPNAHARSELLALLDAHVAKEESGLYPTLVAVGGTSAEQDADLEAGHRERRRRGPAGTWHGRDV